MVEHARIYLIEDEEHTREEARRILTEAGHEVVLEAGNWNEVYDTITRVRNLGINVAVVDGNIDPNSRNCSDGHIITRELRRRAKGIKVVAFSAAPSYEANYGNAYVEKVTRGNGNGAWAKELQKRIKEL